jgi:hypothetical protein
MNDLIESARSACIDENSFYERLFSPYNDYTMCRDIVVDIYKDLGSVSVPPEFEDIIAEIAHHNDEIIMELATSELMAQCPGCSAQYDCWKGKEPWRADSWPEDDTGIECCRSGELEALADYANYNYAAYDFDGLLIRILQDLGYSSGVSHFYWDTVFGMPMPSHLPDQHIAYFNDAQLTLVPEMSMETPFQHTGQLRLAGI